MKKVKGKLATWVLAGVLLAMMAGPATAFELGAFGDVSYVSSDADSDSDNFAIGGLDLYTTQKISEGTKAFFEVVYENDGDGFVLDVERYWITREFSEAFSLGAGRFHAPLGFWNRNYHHGILIQDTVSRPGFLDFEDGDTAILPMHIIGVMATGNLGNGFGYEAAIANSTSYNTDPATSPGEIELGNAEDQSDDKSLFGRLTYASPGFPVNLGLFVMSNNLVESSAAGTAGVAQGEDLVQQTLLGLDVRYRYRDFDLLAEFYSLDNDAEPGVGDGGSHTADAYYVQGGYRFSEKWKAVLRFETLDFDDVDNAVATGGDDAYFDILGISQPEDRTVFALRYDLDDSNALMLEVNSQDPETGDSVTTTTLNWSFLLF